MVESIGNNNEGFNRPEFNQFLYCASQNLASIEAENQKKDSSF